MPTGAAGQLRHIWSIYGPILSNHLNILTTMLGGALLVATSLLNTCISILSKLAEFEKNWRPNSKICQAFSEFGC